MGLRTTARDIFDRAGSGALRRWCEDAKGAHAKAHRFNAAARFCAERRDRTRGAERTKYKRLRAVFVEERDKWERRYEARRELKLPERIHFEELLYHDPPHAHVAVADRKVLEQIADVAIAKFGIRVSEFPYVEDVEPLHVTGSWHYRMKVGGRIVVLSANDWRLKKGGPGGLAFDANDADGGSDEEFAFYLELRARAV